jgi:hypothetical protein
MAEKRELIKIQCRAIVLVRDGDKIIREDTTQDVSCFSLEEMGEFYTKAKAEVDAMNTENNRATRRKNGSSRKTD